MPANLAITSLKNSFSGDLYSTDLMIAILLHEHQSALSKKYET